MNTLHLAKATNGLLKNSGGGNHVKLTASSLLMKNQIAGSSVDPRHDMKIAEDTLGNPLIFSIGNDQVFYLIMRDVSSKTGWKQYDLSTAIAPDGEATAFEVAQGTNGRLLLALAVSPKGKPTQSTLYITPFITNDPTLTDWATVGQQWVARPFPNDKVKIDNIRIGASDGQSALGLAAVATENAVEHYLFNTDAGDKTWLWRKFQLPENAVELQDLAIGTVSGDRGVYALYSTSAGQTLEFTTLPDPVYHKSSRYNFPLLASATSIVALPGKGNSHDLYMAGDGLFLYPNSGSTVTTLAAKQAISGVHELLVRQDSENVAVFAVCGDGLLMHTGGAKNKAGFWAPPIVIQTGVTQISALRNTYKLTNELFLIKGSSSLSYLYQDPESTIWKETTIDLPTIDKIVDFTSYTTHIGIRDADGRPMVNHTFNLTASSWTFVTVNGQFHSLDSTHPVVVTTDLSGNITIINRVNDISTPIFHIQCEYFKDLIDINPAAEVNEGLKKIQSGDDFKNAKLHDGTPLLAGSFSDGTLASAAAALKQLTALNDTLPADGSLQKTDLPNTAIKRRLGSTSRAVVNAGSLPSNYAWGMTFQEGEATFRNAGLLTAGNSVGGFFDAIELAVGDALEWIWQKMKDIGNFFIRVANDVVEFFIEIGEQAYKFVIDAIETSFRVIHWVLKKTLNLDLEKFLQWVGFIFDWDDIKRVHKILVNMANQAINYGKYKIGEIEGTVNDFFEQLKGSAKQLAPIAGGAQSVMAQKNDYEAQQSAQTADWLQQIQASPAGNWGQYQLLHSGAAESVGGTGDGPSDPFTAFVNDIVWPTMQSVETTAQELVKDLKAMFDDDSLSLNAAIQKLTSDAAVALLDAIQKIVVGSMRFIKDLAAYIQKSINEKIEIPFFSAFYRQIAGSDLSILDAVMLVLAIPTTIGYKLVAGKAPFTDESRVLETGDFRQVFGFLSGTPTGGDNLALHAASLGGVEDGKDEPNKPKREELSPALKQYSHYGGIAYLIAASVSDTLGLWAAMTDSEALDMPAGEGKEKLEKKAHNIECWGTAISLAKIPGSFPVGTDEEVSMQRAVWGIYLASPFIEFGLLQAMRKVKLEKWASRAKGGWNILEGITAFVLECIIFDKEIHHDDKNSEKANNEDAANVIKLVQNCFYFISKGTGGVAAILPKSQAKVLLGILSGATVYFAGLFNLARIIMDISDDLEHQNF